MRAKEVRRDKRLLAGVLAVALALVLGILADNFQMVVHAATGTIAADSVRVRKDASTSSEMVGSLTKGVTVTVKDVKDGSDGHKWYQIESEGVSGYVRDDLITVTGEIGGGGTETPPASPTVTVTPVQPLSATTMGGEKIRVRSDADANANNIVAELAQGTAVTVTGQATSADGTTWYQVTYDNNGAQAQGFIRSEYVDLGGAAVVPQDQAPDTENPSDDNPADAPQASGHGEQDYVVWMTGDDGWEGWWFMDREGNPPYGNKYKIDDVLQMVRNYNPAVEKVKGQEKTISTQKVVIIIMALVLVAVVLAGTVLIFKLKDMNDQAYFSAVEKQTIRERNELRRERGKDGQSAPRKTVPASGGEGGRSGASGRTANPGGTRTQGAGGQRPAGGPSRPVNGQPRPASGQSRPAGQSGQPRSAAGQSRPASGQSRPLGQGASASGQGRPAGQGTSVSGQSRPLSQGTSSSGQGRPAGGPSRPVSGQGSQLRSSASAGQPDKADRPIRPGAAPQGVASRDAAEASRQQAKPSSSAGQRQNVNNRPQTGGPSEDDDDFEFEFLNWDGEENS